MERYRQVALQTIRREVLPQAKTVSRTMEKLPRPSVIEVHYLNNLGANGNYRKIGSFLNLSWN
jgi:hypothetical protein